jgi:hypothetical protein
VPCIDPLFCRLPYRLPCSQPRRLSSYTGGSSGAAVAALLLTLAMLGGCATKPAPPVASAATAPAVAAAPAAKPTPPVPTTTAAAAVLPNAAQPVLPTPASPPVAKSGSTPRYITLPPPTPSRTWAEYRLQAARRMVAAHPDTSHMGKPQTLLLGIPVLEIELHSDGSVRNVTVLREPQEAKETIQLAIDAVRRAGPYGDVSRLPKPWKFIETFLFNSDRRFKPRTLD